MPRSQKDPRSWRILDLIFSFSPRILQILDPVTAILPRDPRDLRSRTEKILLDPGDPGSSLSRLSWDLADLGSYPTIMSLYFKHPLHPIKFCFWFLISTRCLTWSTFNHTLIYCVWYFPARLAVPDTAVAIVLERFVEFSRHTLAFKVGILTQVLSSKLESSRG